LLQTFFYYFCFLIKINIIRNENFRNFNVCGKATASQKKLYTEKAVKEGISLSEWIVSTLDISIEKENLLKTRKNEIKRQSDYVKQEELLYYKRGGTLDNSVTKKTKETKPKTNNSNALFNKEINQYKSAASSLNTIGIIALLGSKLLR